MAIEKLLKLWQKKSGKGILRKSIEKREFIRMYYPPTRRPTLFVKEHKFEVLNISEQGLEILNQRQIKLSKNIAGTVVFSSNKSLELIGKIVWKHENELGIFAASVPRSLILEEVRGLLKEVSGGTG